MTWWAIFVSIAIGVGYRVALRSLLYRFLLKVRWKTSWKRAALITLIGLLGDVFFAPIISLFLWHFLYPPNLEDFALAAFTLRFFLEVFLVIKLLGVKVLSLKAWGVGALSSGFQTIFLVFDNLGIGPVSFDGANILIFWPFLPLLAH